MNLKQLNEMIPHPTHELQIAAWIILVAAIVISALFLLSTYSILLWVVVPLLTIVVIWAAFRSAEC